MACGALCATSALALTDATKNTLKAAYGTHNDAVISATSKDLKAKYPDEAKQIDAYLASLNKPAPAAKTPEHTNLLKAYIPFLQAWKGSVQAGADISNGNTHRQQLNGGLKMTRDWNTWALELHATGRSTVEDHKRTEEKYVFGGQVNRNLNDRDFVFGNAEYVNDVFSGFNYRMTETIGYGRHIIKRDNLKLTAQAGIGAQTSEDSVTEKTSTDAVVTPQANLEWKITPNLTFLQNAKATIGNDNTITNTTTALKTKLIGNLSMQAQFDWQHVKSVPTGTKKNDTETTLNLVYDF